MQIQQEVALLAAFRVMDDMDRHMLLAVAQDYALEAVNKKPALRLIVRSNPSSGESLLGSPR
jgi:hypothetical protein